MSKDYQGDDSFFYYCFDFPYGWHCIFHVDTQPCPKEKVTCCYSIDIHFIFSQIRWLILWNYTSRHKTMFVFIFSHLYLKEVKKSRHLHLVSLDVRAMLMIDWRWKNWCCFLLKLLALNDWVNCLWVSMFYLLVSQQFESLFLALDATVNTLLWLKCALEIFRRRVNVFKTGRIYRPREHLKLWRLKIWFK